MPVFSSWNWLLYRCQASLLISPFVLKIKLGRALLAKKRSFQAFIWYSVSLD